MRYLRRMVYLGWVACCRLCLSLSVVLALAGTAAVAVMFPMPAALVGGLLLLKRMRRKSTSGAYGTARFADAADLAAYGMLGGVFGIVLGRADPAFRPSRLQLIKGLMSAPISRADKACRRFLDSLRGKHPGELIRLPVFTHIAAFSPSGRGKGVSYAVTNAMAHSGSLVVNDPKRELFRITAWIRRRFFGQQVVHLDPFGGSKDTFNALSLIHPDDPRALDQIKSVANAMVIRTGHETDPHWNDSAERFLYSIIAFVVAHGTPEERNLQTVQDILASPESLKNAIAAMQRSTAMGGMLKRLGNQLTHYQGEELSSVLTTVARHCAFLDSLPVAASMRATSFDPAGLRSGSLSIYLTIPEDQLHTQAALLRLWIVSLLRYLTRDGADESRPVLFLLDEAAHIGRFQALEDAISLLRGYGIRLFFFFQSVSQLKDCFGEPGKFLDNMDTQIYWGLNDYASAEAVSKRLGKETVVVTSETDGDSTSRPIGGSFGQPPQQGNYTRNRSKTTSETGRDLLTPDEILRLPEDRVIVTHKNMPPILARRVFYYNDPEFQGGPPLGRNRLGVRDGVRCLLMLGVAAMYALGMILLLEERQGSPAMQRPVSAGQAKKSGKLPPYRNAYRR
ncbi:type IV secretory system conjugative DNA transfer family protein [Paludisphaera sp.]|uniref:type IV secretory system conjugative DNA transfer family protein n=1 Tax=Paludisphaera sp. TaxID=2017432 RepID=UPI00301DF9ED